MDAAVGRVGEAVSETARDLSDATARQLIEDLEPYLIAETVPRLVAGITPYLVSEAAPEIIDGVTGHLSQVTVPAVMDGITGVLIEEKLPEIVTGLTPAMVDELIPRILEGLRPHLEEVVVPQIVDALVPHISSQVAPQLIDSLMPQIRSEVVPVILDDIVDDPKVRELIREQSQGLILDIIERGRRGFAHADNVIEDLARAIFRRPPRPSIEPDTPPPPPSRSHANAGAVSRVSALTLDIVVVSSLIGVVMSWVTGLLQTTFADPLPHWLVLCLTGIGACLLPIYFGLCWWTTGRTGADALFGLRTITKDGVRPGFWRSAWRAAILLPFAFIWIPGIIPAFYQKRRRSWWDQVSGAEVLYVVNRSTLPLEVRREMGLEAPSARLEDARLQIRGAGAPSPTQAQ